jgi:hypothetical protein
MVINNDINDFIKQISFQFYNLLQRQPPQKINHVLSISHIWSYNFVNLFLYFWLQVLQPIISHPL